MPIMNLVDISSSPKTVWWYFASILILIVGAILAAQYYPGGFDWAYTVASALASQKHNPAGSVWFATALLVSMVLLLPYVSDIKKSLEPSTAITRYAIGILRIGIVCGALLGAERLFFYDLSKSLYKAHEILALLTFFGLYFGVIGLLIQAMLRQRIYAVPVLLVTGPLLGIGVTQFWLYLEQRNLGWVDINWREMGIPLWVSFAFWQWLAIGLLFVGLGLLSFIRPEEQAKL